MEFAATGMTHSMIERTCFLAKVQVQLLPLVLWSDAASGIDDYWCSCICEAPTQWSSIFVLVLQDISGRVSHKGWVVMDIVPQQPKEAWRHLSRTLQLMFWPHTGCLAVLMRRWEGWTASPCWSCCRPATGRIVMAESKVMPKGQSICSVSSVSSQATHSQISREVESELWDAEVVWQDHKAEMKKAPSGTLGTAISF